MLVSKDDSIGAVLDLEEFLKGNFSCKDASPDLMERDRGLAEKYYFVLAGMRSISVERGDSFLLPDGEDNCFLVDKRGVAVRRTIKFDEIKLFSDYVVMEYGI